MVAQTISLLVKPETAQLVVLADQMGDIRLIMRSPEDDDIPTVADTTPSILLDAAESEDPLKEDPLAGSNATQGPGFLNFLDRLRSKKGGTDQTVALPQPPTARNVHRMRIIDGPEIRDVLLEMDEGQSNPASGFEVWSVKQDWDASALAPPAGTPEPAADEEQDPAEEEARPQQPQEASD